MATVTAHPNCRGARNASLLLAAAGLTAILLGLGTRQQSSEEELEGSAPTAEGAAAVGRGRIPARELRPGSERLTRPLQNARGVTLRIFHTGPEHAHTVGNNSCRAYRSHRPKRSAGPRRAAPSGSASETGRAASTSPASTASDGRVGFAPFIVRPRRLGEHRVAVVLPTLTWQAYNLRDDNGDGKGDTWYANWKVHTARLGRPFLNRGVPYNFRRYDLPVPALAGLDGAAGRLPLRRRPRRRPDGQALASAYDLIVFPGHHEYVTTHEYDLVQSYRDLGGNLAFLSANNFFWRVVRHGT